MAPYLAATGAGRAVDLATSRGPGRPAAYVEQATGLAAKDGPAAARVRRRRPPGHDLAEFAERVPGGARRLGRAATGSPRSPGAESDRRGRGADGARAARVPGLARRRGRPASSSPTAPCLKVGAGRAAGLAGRRWPPTLRGRRQLRLGDRRRGRPGAGCGWRPTTSRPDRRRRPHRPVTHGHARVARFRIRHPGWLRFPSCPGSLRAAGLWRSW